MNQSGQRTDPVHLPDPPLLPTTRRLICPPWGQAIVPSLPFGRKDYLLSLLKAGISSLPTHHLHKSPCPGNANLLAFTLLFPVRLVVGNGTVAFVRQCALIQGSENRVTVSTWLKRELPRKPEAWGIETHSSPFTLDTSSSAGRASCERSSPHPPPSSRGGSWGPECACPLPGLRKDTFPGSRLPGI